MIDVSAQEVMASLAVGPLDLASFSDDSDDEGDTNSRAQLSTHGDFLRNTARVSSAVRAWHGVIESAEHRTALEKDAETLAQGDTAGDTFWIEADDAPRCTLERLALAVMRFHAGTLPPGAPPVRGAEWWVQVRRSGSQPTIGLHWDCDELHKRASGEHLPPWMATVTYLGSCGAPTVVLPAAADAKGRAVRAGPCCAHISHPVPGKHLAFDGRMLHGALHDMEAPSAQPVSLACAFSRCPDWSRLLGVNQAGPEPHQRLE